MPLFLPQLTRREFLKRAALAGAAVALAPQTHASIFGKARDKNTFAFLSDNHVAADAAFTHSEVNMADNLAACVRQIADWPMKPASVIVNGDLAFQAGLAGDYATFGKIIAPIRAVAPVHLSLGNHDERENFWKAFPHDAKKQKAVPQKQATIFSSKLVNWFMLDSLDATDTAPGEVGAAQYAWLARELDLRSEKPAIIVCHHNLQTPGSTTGLKDTAAMEEIFARHRQIKAYICGHTHDWHVEEHPTGVQLINLPPTAYVFKAGRPSGWVRLTLARDGAELELRCLDPMHPEHAEIKWLNWRTA